MKGEDKLVDFLARRFPAGGPVRTGIGDDAAVLRLNPATDWVVTTDQLIENVHFLRKVQPARSVGWKALARSLSDLAAMAARPRFALVSLALPPRLSGRWSREFFAGLGALAHRYRVRIVGGDLARAPQVMADVQAIGEVDRSRALLRSGARSGQAIYVTGRLGLSALGQRLVRSRSRNRPSGLIQDALRAHFYPEPRIQLARRLARAGATAMIDLSDGLSTDLARLCRASRVGARVYGSHIPTVEVPPPLLRRFRTTPLELALNGGEDYELLFTIPESVRLPGKLLGIPLTRIGEITKRRRLMLADSPGSGRERRLQPGGWDHFRP